MNPIRRALLIGDPPALVAAVLKVPREEVEEADRKLAIEARARAAVLGRVATMPSQKSSAAAGPAGVPQPDAAPGSRGPKEGGWQSSQASERETPVRGAARVSASYAPDESLDLYPWRRTHKSMAEIMAAERMS